MSAHGLRIVCMDSEYHALKFESDQNLALSRKSHRHPNHARIELKHDDQVDSTVFALAWSTLNMSTYGWTDETIKNLGRFCSELSFYRFYR